MIKGFYILNSHVKVGAWKKGKNGEKMTTGEKIAELRRKKGITQEHLAELLNISRQSVSRWESDIAFPETEKLIKLSRLLDCSIDFLLMEKATLSSQNNLPVSVYDCYRFIRESGYFFMATSVEDQPGIRPMGQIYTDEKFLYFATDKRKKVYEELLKNPKIALASYNMSANRWMRILGSVQEESSISVKEEMINMYPAIVQEFANENEIYFATFRITIRNINW